MITTPPSASPPDPWLRLAAAARSAPLPPAPDDLDGFSGRVVRRWLSPRPSDTRSMSSVVSQLWQIWTLRALAAGGAVALGVLALNYQALSDTTDSEPVTSLDPVAELLASL